MTYERIGPQALDYMPCRYGTSKLLFRGPRRKLTGPHVLFLGGTETYGKFLARPLPALAEDALGMTCVNLGAVNAGPDLYLNDPVLMGMGRNAAAVVIEVMGAANLSNRYYAVHPRRNDRFLHASQLLETVFRDVDFTEFHFTRHMLQSLADLSPDRFAIVVEELRAAWMARMGQLIDQLRAPVVLHWFARRSPEAGGEDDPMFVDRPMIEALRPKVAAVVETVPAPAVLTQATAGMVYSQMEAPAAARLMGAPAHELACLGVSRALAALPTRRRTARRARPGAAV